jgi:hypothetical protein
MRKEATLDGAPYHRCVVMVMTIDDDDYDDGKCFNKDNKRNEKRHRVTMRHTACVPIQ